VLGQLFGGNHSGGHPNGPLDLSRHLFFQITHISSLLLAIRFNVVSSRSIAVETEQAAACCWGVALT